MAEYNYFVMGRSRFPFDMLRFDRCWPRRAEDVARMTDLDPRTIRITSNQKPTPDRWASFGWHLEMEKN